MLTLDPLPLILLAEPDLVGCRVHLDGYGTGTVRYAGPAGQHEAGVFAVGQRTSPHLIHRHNTDFAPEGGAWLGVELDEPRGLHDGAVAGRNRLDEDKRKDVRVFAAHNLYLLAGRRYFQCAAGHGTMTPVHAAKVQLLPDSRPQLHDMMDVSNAFA